MHWKTKAFIQRACSALPVGAEAAYYGLQRKFGSLRQPPDPMPNIRDLADIANDLANSDFSIEGKRVMEVGTGRRLDMPMGLYLLGASSVDTYDLHPYLRDELVQQALAAVLRHSDEVVALYSPLTGKAAVEERLKKLTSVATVSEFQRTAGIRYHAPADATQTSLPEASIDLQFSYTVFEHIPKSVLVGILKEASRVLSPTGLACHHVDPSDHFAHDDETISFVNFLQYEEAEWSKYNDNQFAYHNRLRVDAYEQIYREADHDVLRWRTWKNERGLKELTEGSIPLATAYLGVAPEILGTTAVRVISRRRV